MDESRFDRLARSFAMRHTRRAAVTLFGGTLAASAIVAESADAKHRKKKKKKKCAQKCASGCCTSKYGACIQPAQQSNALCGTGGAICRSSGCAGACPNCQCSASSPCPTGQCCGGDGTCGPCLVFATSTRKFGAMGALKGADAICQGLAENAGLPGAYLAWLSNSSTSPSTRFTRATVPYMLVNGAIIADDWNDLTGGALKHAIDRTETDGDATELGNVVWTNTLPNGTAGGPVPNGNCTDWTHASTEQFGNTGRLTSTTSWTSTTSTDISCRLELRFYCFQQR